jgi:hypothetical protein
MNRAPYLAALLFTAFSHTASAQPPAREVAAAEPTRQTFVNLDTANNKWCRVVFNDAKTGADTVTVTKGDLKPGQREVASSDPGKGSPISVTARNGMTLEQARTVGNLACGATGSPQQTASAPTSSF